jgi:hypothetical protein
MLKIIALVGFAAALAFAPVAAVAQGATGYGTYGPQQGTSTFDRAWNASHLSKTYAYTTSRFPRHHYGACRDRGRRHGCDSLHHQWSG